MWTEERNGKYRFFERYKDPMTGKYRTVSVTMDRNTAQARKKAQSLLNEKIAHEQAAGPGTKLTLSQMLEECLVLKKQTVKESTFACIKSNWSRTVEILGGDTLVENLTARYVRQRFMEDSTKTSLVNHHIKEFKQLMRYGYRHDMVKDIQFIEKIEILKDVPHRVRIQDKFLEHEEINTLLNAIRNDRWKYVTEFMLLSGLRFGEVAALTKTDVDLNEKLIHVTRTYNYNIHSVMIPKTLSSSRDVYIQPELYALCRKILTWTKKQELEKGIRSELFIHDSDGTVLCNVSYNKFLARLSEQVLNHRITSHALRHTHASLLMEQGVDIDTISRRLGHENSKITRDIYLHVTEKLKEHDKEKLENTRLLS